MSIPRRQFIKLSSLATLSAPFLVQGCSLDGKKGMTDNPAAEDIYRLFQEPPDRSRVFVRWWWNGDMLTEEEIIRELDIMKDAGIGGVEINPIKLPAGSDPVGYKALEWLSDEWVDMLQVTLKAARERGIICDTIVGSGWPFGGEFLDRVEQTQLMTFGTIDLEGPGTYRLSRKSLLEQVDPAIHSKYDQVHKEITEVRLIPASMNEFDPGKDLSGLLSDDEIHVEVPENNFVLYYLVKLTGFQAVINGAPGAAGPVLNHYNKSAVEKYLTRMSVRLHRSLGSLGDHFRAMFCDSLEMEGANWVDDLPEEFLKRRGYDLKPYLPFVLYKIGHMGNPVEEPYGTQFSPEVGKILERVRYDFYITRLELFRERFIDTFNDWCHSNNVSSRIQAYGRGYHPLDASMYIDIPECETWLRETVGTEFANTGWQGRAYSVINKFVASGARLAGNRMVSCEEITNTSMVFNASLETIKVTGDQSNLSGVTHSVLHGFNYSPPEAPFPGWVQYGTFFNEKNPWWPYFRLWSDYKARLSSVFQQAEPFADIAILHPLADMWMKFGPQRDPFPVVNYPEYQHNVWEAIQQNGFGCDYVSEQVLEEASFETGKMKYGTRNYTTLILLEVEAIRPESAEAIRKFAEAGGRIIFIGKLPDGSPGYLNHAENDRKVKETMGLVVDSNQQQVGVFRTPEGNMIAWFQDMARQFRLQSSLRIHNPHPFINQVYFRTDDLDIFFIANYSVLNPYFLSVKFDIPGKIPWLWDPETGQRKKIPSESAGGEMSLDFGPAETKLIVFDGDRDGEIMEKVETALGDPVAAEGPWTIRLNHVDGSSVEIQREELFDLNEDEQFRNFAGVITYRIEKVVQQPENFKFIDLGRVTGVSELKLNGESLGVRWYGNHRYPLTGRLKKGTNDMEIRVTTVLGNYMKSLQDNRTAQRWTSRQDYQPMGLLGPVVFYPGFDA
ncbi:MAG: hypothetical protein KFF73_19375 [Cyclobacteriaceae bacterium]|nr:hypothetical protein [Cyclobacteriaceae bacterium]